MSIHTVSEAIRTRKTTRIFDGKPVSGALIRDILALAAQAPSNGNVQPWQVTVLTGTALEHAVEVMNDGLYTDGTQEEPEYAIYPPKLGEPYRTRRYRCGELMYEALGIPRDDKPARIRQVLKNYAFFGAPVGMIVTIQNDMDLGQAVDVGIFLQNLMLLAHERGLATCAQASWAQWPRRVRKAMNIPDDRKIIVGLAVGYAAEHEPVNQIDQPRIGNDEFVTFAGFGDLED